ncbi:MAG: hypothetical protein EA424_07715 [Planctomycetaceae bacterium]|nr:MAG: hypothetical protein EA424_07715 [Planctomycetaceae bacterium]
MTKDALGNSRPASGSHPVRELPSLRATQFDATGLAAGRDGGILWIGANVVIVSRQIRERTLAYGATEGRNCLQPGF